MSDKEVVLSRVSYSELARFLIRDLVSQFGCDLGCFLTTLEKLYHQGAYIKLRPFSSKSCVLCSSLTCVSKKSNIRRLAL